MLALLNAALIKFVYLGFKPGCYLGARLLLNHSSLRTARAKLKDAVNYYTNLILTTVPVKHS